MSMFADAHDLVINGGLFNLQHTYQEITDARVAAFENLQKAGALGASHDSNERYPAPKCLPYTRMDVISTIRKWMKDPRRTSDILWLYGPAGAGKTAIAQTLSEQYKREKKLAASFFFSRNSQDRNNETRLIATLSYQLALAIPHAKPVIVDALIEDPSILSKSMESQAEKLMVNPLKKVKPGFWRKSRRKVIIIDGLDECQTHEAQCRILRVIIAALEMRFPFCFIISSRPEPDIRDTFSLPPMLARSRLVALDDSFTAREDIRIFLRTGFADIQRRRLYNGKMPKLVELWPSEDIIETLVYKSSGYFIYAATVLNFVENRQYHPAQNLEIILGRADRGIESPFAGLDQLYIQILTSVSDVPFTMRIIGVMQLLAEPLPCDALEELLSLESGDIYRALSDLNSILHIPDSNIDSSVDSSDFSFYHKSFYDFLLDPSRSGALFMDVAALQADLTLCCLRMIHGASNFGTALNYSRHRSGQEAFDYALVHWIDHLRDCLAFREVIDALRGFDFSTWISLIAESDAKELLDRIPEIVQQVQLMQRTPTSFFPLNQVCHDLTNSLDQYFNSVLKQCSELDCLAALTSYPSSPSDEIITKLLHLTGEQQHAVNDNYQNPLFGLLGLNAFREFLDDASRCHKYYFIAGIHASISLCFMRYIMTVLEPDFECEDPSLASVVYHSEKYVDNFAGAFYYALENWESHLLRAYPTPELIVYVREVANKLNEPINVHRIRYFRWGEEHFRPFIIRKILVAWLKDEMEWRRCHHILQPIEWSWDVEG